MAKALRIRGAGGPEVLHIEDFEPPSAAAGEVQVEIAACGLNRADVLQRRGFYPAPKGTVADIPGLEFAGTVSALGQASTRWKLGDKVMGICAGGGMATHIAVPEGTLLPVPRCLDLIEAAAVPEVYLTAFDALQQGGMYEAGAAKTVLVHAVGSGVGVAAVQLIQRAGGVAIGTSRTQDKLDRARELGLAHSILVEDKRFAVGVKELRAQGVDIILDFIGAAYLAENLQALATCGRLVVIGLLGGVSAELSLGLLLAKRASIIGTVLRSRSTEEKVALTKSFSESIMPDLESGILVPVTDRVFDMKDVAQAHEYMESNQSFGKIVMRW